MGRHNLECKKGYKKRRRQAKIQKKRQLKNKIQPSAQVNSENNHTCAVKDNCLKEPQDQQSICTSKTFSPCSSASINSVKSDKDSSNIFENSSVCTQKSCSSVSNICSTERFISNLKRNKVKKQDMMDYERDPLYIKWQEYKLLSKRIRKLEGTKNY